MTTRWVGATLLTIVLSLPLGSVHAAGLSYDDYVAQAKAGKTDIDYTAFRMAYAASPNYAPYGASQIQAGEMKQAYNAGDCSSAMAKAKDILATISFRATRTASARCAKRRPGTIKRRNGSVRSMQGCSSPC